MTHPTRRLLPPIHGVQTVGVVAVRREEEYIDDVPKERPLVQ